MSETTAPVKATEDYVFDVPGTGTASRALAASSDVTVLTGAYTTPFFDDGVGVTSEINAYTPEQEQEVGDAPPEATLPPDGEGATAPGMQPQSLPQALAASSRGIATWAARNNNYTGLWEYGNDCANFVSKAISWGWRLPPDQRGA